jgi:UDPglucose 6-dehydrogenase
MKVTAIGTGYVGLVTGACLAEMGNHVVCFDIDPNKIDTLKAGRLPIHEPGLLPIVERNVAAGRLEFTSDAAAAIRHGTILFIGVGTPPDEDGSADLRHVLAAAASIGRHMSDYKVVVDKSTVPVGTADKVKATIAAELAARGVEVGFDVVSNPEFLKEGAAVEDCMKPDRVIIGTDSERALMLMRALYSPFLRNHDRLMAMDARSAELTKYAANAMLATRISFMNDLSRLADEIGADIDLVRKGIGSDPRIGYDFLYPGTGYGGSCFPKDVKALIRMGSDAAVDLRILRAVEDVNETQKRVLVDKIVRRFGEDLSGRTFAIWGLAFKPNTDDMREAPSQVIVGELVRRGAACRCYDPVAAERAKEVFSGLPRVEFAQAANDALEGADALVVVTEWKEFRSPDDELLRSRLKERVVFDGRNLYDPPLMREAGLEYHGIGRGTAVQRRG